MRDYELVVVLSPEVGDEGYPATVERISNFIQERGGEIKNVDQWGRRRLAYPIRRYLEGFYAVTRFVAEPEVIRPLEASLDLAEDVLRHLVIKIEEAQLVAAAATAARASAAAEARAAEAASAPPALESPEPQAEAAPVVEATAAPEPEATPEPAPEEEPAAGQPEG